MTAKDARSGPLVFVTVRHEIATPAGLAIEEDHDIVYRGLPAPGAAAAAPAAPRDEVFARAIVPDAVLLFRYSALTFNGHRIHYDRRYVTAVEGYPGLIVHGPLIATLLLDLLRRERPDASVVRFEFKAREPAVRPASVRGLRPARRRAPLRALGAQPRRRAGDAGERRRRLTPQRQNPAMLKSAPDRFQDIRDAVRALCAQFPDSYHREIDAAARLPRGVRRRADQGRLARRADPAGLRRLGPRPRRGVA